MAQRCKQCSRANPPEAVYCHHDGFVLEGHGRPGGPVAVGAQRFASPFVFPNGRSCRSFDELAFACQEHWDTACALLKDGYLESFLGGLGRTDLAMAAKEASHFPDPSRGLDQLLAALPVSVLAEPKLHVEPGEVNLGLVESDDERAIDLELENQGMRLLYGTVSATAPWLMFGEAREKLFRFTHDCRLAVRVLPARLRAGGKPEEARLIVASNAGTVTVRVRAERRVRAFPGGALAGATTPRQVAEKAQASPKEVAPLFESGEVERWYAANGWVYPVKIPAASGVAGIQQFFEALGVTKAPKVEISQRSFELTGDPGAPVSFSLEVSTREKRPVFAHATSNADWLHVARPRHTGKTVVLDALVLAVPNQPGRTLTAEMDVVANGNARWKVPVSLRVSGEAPAEDTGTAESGDPFDFAQPPPAEGPTPAEVTPAPPAKRPAGRRGAPVWMHAAPLVLLLASVGSVVLFDVFRPKIEAIGEAKAGPIAGPTYDVAGLRDARPLLRVQFAPEDRFGVTLIDPQRPDDASRWAALTSRPDGSSNNTVVKIDGNEYLFGYPTPSNVLRPSRQPLPAPYVGWSSVMNCRDEQVRVTQYLQVIPGQDNALDTLLIHYTATNYGDAPRKVALRVLLDTCLGKHDGLPVIASGEPAAVTTRAEYTGKDVPDYLEIVERPDDDRNAGLIARVGLRGVGWGDVDLLEPDRVRVCRSPGPRTRWDWDPEAMGDNSCVAVYWPEEELAAKRSVRVAMTYGAGKLDISDQLALSAPASSLPGREFTVTGHVYNAEKGQRVTLTLPAGLELVGGKPEQTIAEAARQARVFWKVRAKSEGAMRIEAVSGRSRARPVIVHVRKRSIFG